MILPAIALSLTLLPSAYGGAPELRLSLKDAEAAALADSPRLRSAELEAEAADNLARSQRSILYPRLELESSAKYVTEVPEISLPVPGARALKLGDNWNYTVGPSLYWTAFDNGARRYGWRSLKELAQSKHRQAEGVRREIILQARSDYFKLELSLEQTVLIGDSLKLAQAQYEDIRLNVKAGVKSRIDELLSHQELLARRRELQQARAALAQSLRDLFALTGLGGGLDASFAMDLSARDSMPKDVEPPTLFLGVDTIEDSLMALEPARSAQPDPSHPNLEALSELSRSLRSASQSYASEKWPIVQLMARTSLDYPNGPILKQINQNTAGISVSMPLFEYGKNDEKTKENANRASSAQESRKQLEDDILRDWRKSHDRLKSLAGQQETNKLAAQEARELAALVYDSYKAGRSTYIEVETANLRELEAKVQTADTGAQILLELAILAGLSR